MDTLVQVLTLGTAFIIFLAVFRRSIWHGPARTPAKPPLVQISDSAVARTALIDHADAFSNRPQTLFPVALVTGHRRRRSDSISSAQYGPLWRALRCNLTSEALHPARFDQLAPLRRESAADLVASLSATIAAGNGSDVAVVVRDSVHAAVFGLIARLCFGGDLVGGDAAHLLAMRRVMQQFVRAIGEANAFGGSWLAKLVHWRQWRRFVGYRGQQAAFFLPLVAERERRRRSGCCRDDADGGIRPYVDTLIDLRVPDDDGSEESGDARRKLTDDEMVSLLSEFLGASTESVVSCVEWALAHLVARPEAQEKLRREIAGGDQGGGGAVPEERLRTLPYLHAVVLEALRLHPPVPFLMREVHEGANGGPTSVPALDGGGGRTRVHFLIRDMARDSKDWTDPDAFWPERFLADGEAEGVGAVPGPKEIRMMPFGAGRRYCPGAGMGMLHIKCFLAALVREFEWAPAADGGGVDFTELDGFFKVMKTPLRAHVKRST